MTDQTAGSGQTPHDPSQPLSFTAPTPPAFTPPPPAPAPAVDLDPQPPEQDEAELADEAPEQPSQHPDAPGFGITDKFPIPADAAEDSEGEGE